METSYIVMIVLVIFTFIALLLFTVLFLYRFYNPVPLITHATVIPSTDRHFNILNDQQRFVLENKTLVLYAYNEASDVRKANLEFFIKYGFYPDHPLIDYLFIVSGKATINLPLKLNGTNYTIFTRENKNRDFAAWKDGMNHLGMETILQKYVNFVFINDSVRGPVIPTYANNLLWVAPFISKLSHQVKVVGTSICTIDTPHVQTFAWATDSLFLNILIKENVFDPPSGLDTITYFQYTEKLVSVVAFQHGFNIDCFIAQFQGWNWKEIYEHGKDKGIFVGADGSKLSMWNPTLWGQAHPLELLFFKYKTSPVGVFQFYHLE